MANSQHRVMCEDAQRQIDLDEIVAGSESEINDDHSDIVNASDPWTPVFAGSLMPVDIKRLQELSDTDLVDTNEFHLPSEID